MRYNLSRLLGVLVGIPIAIISWVTSVFGFDLSFILDALIGIGMFFVSYFPTQRLTSKKYLNEIGLSRRDYRFVNQQLNQSHNKIRNILKSYINIRSIKDFRQINDIYKISKQRPSSFFKVESFFYSHIDNALNLIDAYTRLSKMPKKSAEEKQKLEQTRITLDEVKRTLIADLKRLNEDDYERLDIEMELNRLQHKRYKKY